MRHMTIVYTINDEEAFKSEAERMEGLFSSSEGKPWAITAWSRDHEMNRVDLIRDAIDARCDLDVIDNIVNAANIKGRTLDSFR